MAPISHQPSSPLIKRSKSSLLHHHHHQEQVVIKTTTKNKESVPLDVLEQISSQVLEYTKQLGLFDELRVKLLDRIEGKREFNQLSENFHHEVDKFCRGQEVKLEQPRAKLRQQLQDQSYTFKSTAKLHDSVAQAMRKYELELRREYDARQAEIVSQIGKLHLLTTKKGDKISDAKTTNKVHETRLLAPIVPPTPIRTIPTPSPSVSSPSTPSRGASPERKRDSRHRHAAGHHRERRHQSYSPERHRRTSSGGGSSNSDKRGGQRGRRGRGRDFNERRRRGPSTTSSPRAGANNKNGRKNKNKKKRKLDFHQRQAHFRSRAVRN